MSSCCFFVERCSCPSAHAALLQLISLSHPLTGLTVQGQNNSNIHLKVDIQPSIALFLFCDVSKLSKDQGSSTVASAAQTLLTVAQISSTHGYIASVLSDRQQLQVMMDTASQEATQEQQLKCSVTAPDCRLPQSHRPFVLFAQLLVLESSLSTGNKSTGNSRGSGKQHRHGSRAAGQPGRCAMASRLRAITQHGFSAEVQKQLLNEHWQNKAKCVPVAAANEQQIGSRLLTLRIAFLLLKLASLLNAVKHTDAETVISVIFSLLCPLAQDLDSSKHTAASAEAAQEYQLSLFLIQLLLPLLKQHMKVSGGVAPALFSLVEALLDTEPEDTLSALSLHFMTLSDRLYSEICVSSACLCPDLFQQQCRHPLCPM